MDTIAHSLLLTEQILHLERDSGIYYEINHCHFPLAAYVYNEKLIDVLNCKPCTNIFCKHTRETNHLMSLGDEHKHHIVFVITSDPLKIILFIISKRK